VKKDLVKKLKAIFFLISFSFSITGHTLELHYCQGKVTDVSLIGHANCFCGQSHAQVDERETESNCEKHCHSVSKDEKKIDVEIKKENCCKTEKLTFLSPSIKALSNTDIPLWTVSLSILDPTFFIQSVYKQSVNPLAYIAPILHRDITILTGTFLI